MKSVPAPGKLLLTALCLVFLLQGCGAAAPEETAEASRQQFVSAPITAVAEDPEPAEETYEYSNDDMAQLPADPPYDFDVDTMVPSDFGDFFTENYETQVSSYSLLPGDAYENQVTVLTGAGEGPTIYVIAGIHGDEEAAWQTGKLLKKIGIQAGTLYILAPANPWGAEKVPKSRYVDGKDMNRAFPGDASGTNAQRVANAIYSDVADKAPDFVFDLHEAIIVENDRDVLGSSLIFTSLEGMEDVFLDLYSATECGEICSEPFTYFEALSSGTVNYAVTTGLGIPTITVETYRGYQMETRISDQLDIVQYVLHWYGMV